MKKITQLFLMICCLATVWQNTSNVQATDFKGNESYWTEYCSGIITDANKQQQCNEYQKYVSDSLNTAKQNAGNLSASIGEVKDDLSNLREVSQAYTKQIEGLKKEIETINKSIEDMNKNLTVLAGQIETTRNKIEERKKVITNRMVAMQPGINTNRFLDYLMGAQDLVDMIQRLKGLQAFTRSDKKQIALYNQEQADLENQLNEQVRLKDNLQVQQNNLKAKEQQLAELKASNDKMIDEYEKKVAEMTAQLNQQNASIKNFEVYTPDFSAGISAYEDDDGSHRGTLKPMVNATVSCGLGGYSGHLGVDYSASIGTPIVAPADGIIVFARNNHPTNDGPTMEEPMGAPIGGGNCFTFICSAKGQTLAFNVYHCTQNMPAAELIAVNGGYVKQGTVIGYVGNSGNSFGAHAHIECYEVDMSVSNAVQHFESTHDFVWGCGWSSPKASSGIATRVSATKYF